ncbi:MAG TPA: protein kinase [Thermoanaerobaculia bacterium]|nr:protein kinase [Thermoanaerobaculia bacterium]
MSTSPGSLEGKYEVLAKIREGGMGAIYKVRHRLLNELRVIKVMRPEVAQSSEQRKRFLREAQTATRLRHTNIVAFHDFFIDDEDTAYMVMEYIEGINLRDMVREFGPFPVSLALDVSRQCLSAFEYLHRKGVVHRDVSPDNVMMTREEDGVVRAKLIDLGIAKIAQAKEELTGADEFIGKLRYSSPEQLTSSAQIDARSDLFSFGIVLYEILTGTRPYGGETIHEIVANRLNQPPLPFDETDPSGRLSPALRETVLKALRSRPDERYQTAAEFSKALESLGDADADPGNVALVAGYADRAMALAIQAAAQAEVVGGDLNAPVKDVFRTGGSRPSASDVKFRTSIARWAEATPEAPGDAKTLQLASEDPTVMPALPHDWSTARTRPVTGPTEAQPQRIVETARKSPMAGYLAAAVVAALLVGFGIWIAGREKSESNAALDRPAAATVPSIEPTAPAAPTAPAGEPARKPDGSPGSEAVKPIPPPAEDPRAAGPRTAEAPTPQAAARPRPTSAPRVALARPTTVPRPKETAPEPAAAAAPVRTGPKMSYCLQQDDTVFKQGVVRDVPTGFGDIATKAPRPDSGLMRMLVSLSAERPVDDQPFSVIVRFENGGDSRVDVQRLEESASRGGLRAVAGAAVPVSVSPGGIKELHRYPLSLSGGEPYNKQFVAIDSKGDSWKTGLRIVPCGD